MAQNDTQQLKEYLPYYVNQITQKSKGTNMYVCPFCHSGTGKNKTGAFSITESGTQWKCFRCDRGGDIFTLVGEWEGISSYGAQQKRVQEIFSRSTLSYKEKPVAVAATSIKDIKDTPPEELSDFFTQAQKNIGNTQYPQQRGLGPQVIQRFSLGFVENWRHPKSPKSPPSPRLIIPTSKTSYLARDTRSEIPDKQKAYSKSKVGHIALFNLETVATATKPIFVVEGEIDALSVMEVGGEAIALGTTAKWRALLAYLQETPPAKPLIISLDNDDAGQKTKDLLQQGLIDSNIPFFTANIAGEYKDANEALQRNREAFCALIEQAEYMQTEMEENEKKRYLASSTANYVQSFLQGITQSVNTSVVETGFTALDTALDGGLYEGLYIVGAISSLGKTTLVSQIADQVAQSGQDVLFFSLEMARAEIMAKSISRHTLLEELDKKGVSGNAKTARGITTGKRYLHYSLQEKELIKLATTRYSAFANNIYISEGMGDIGVQQVRQTVEKHIAYTKKVPLVIIDYIQILAPYNPRSTDKQNTDKAVMELKRISRDFKLPLIGISSFNRASYKESVTMEAFKESGAIEYSSDVLIGLQLKGAGQKEFDATYAKQQNPREIELVVLKSRNAKVGARVEFKYYPLFNYFEEE